MYTYGYLREAVMAHCDLEEDELQAMNVLKRLHIYANEAMQAICACKPNYKYFKAKIVKENKQDGEYLIGEEIKMPDGFIAFTNKQTFIVKRPDPFSYEDFVNGRDWTTNEAERLEPVNYNKDIMFVGQNTVKCLKEGEFMIPYKCVWFIFNSAQSDITEIDIPIDVFNCIPLYIASEVLQIDYTQKAQIKRSEFEMALSRIIVTNNMPVNRIKPSF